MAGLVDGFVYMMVNSIFGSALLFALFFIFIVISLLFVAKCSLDQIFIFMLIPSYYFFNGGLLVGLAGGSIFALVAFINSFLLYRNISKIID